MIYRFIILLIVTSLFSVNCISQTPTPVFEWAKANSGTHRGTGQAITTDSFKNTIITGFFFDTTDFDPGINTYNLITNGGYNTFVQKLDSNGNFIWAISLQGSNSGNSGESVVVDSLGNIYILGNFYGTTDFNPDTNTHTLTSSNIFTDVYILKLDKDGNFIWVREIKGSNWIMGHSIKIDDFGYLYMTGNYQGTADFLSGTGTLNINSKGDYDVFIQKMDLNGNLIWAKSVGGQYADEGLSIDIDSVGNSYITGNYRGSADFDPGVNWKYLSAAGTQDAFILKLNPNGDYVWAKSLGGSNSATNGAAISFSPSKKIFITGYYNGSVDFNPDLDSSYILINGAVGISMFIVKLDIDGDFVWAKSIGGSYSINSRAITTDNNDNIYIAGDFIETVDFDPSNNTYNLTPIDYNDIFIEKLDSNGNFIWAEAIGDNQHDYSYALSLTKDNSITLTGSFESTVDFDINSGIYNLTSTGLWDIYILKLNQLITSNIIEKNNLNYPKLYPNPALNQLNIESNNFAVYNIKVYDITGKPIILINQNTNLIDISSLSAGLYFVEISTINGTFVERFVKN